MWIGAQYTITASAARLTTILAQTIGNVNQAKQIDIKNATGAANVLYLGPSTVTNVPANARAELAAGQSFSFNTGGGGYHVSTDDIYLVGTANAANIAFISVLI